MFVTVFKDYAVIVRTGSQGRNYTNDLEMRILSV